MLDFAVLDFLDLRSPLKNMAEFWNSDGHHLNARCSDGKIQVLLEGEFRPIIQQASCANS